MKSSSEIVFAAKIAVIISVTVAFFFGDFSILFTDAFYSEASSFVLAIPFIVVYILYRKRRVIGAVSSFKADSLSRNVSRFSNVIASLCVLTAVLFYWYGSFTFTPLVYHVMTLPLFVSGLVLLFFNFETLNKKLALALENGLTLVLQNFLTSASHRITCRKSQEMS